MSEPAEPEAEEPSASKPLAAFDVLLLTELICELAAVAADPADAIAALACVPPPVSCKRV